VSCSPQILPSGIARSCRLILSRQHTIPQRGIFEGNVSLFPSLCFDEPHDRLFVFPFLCRHKIRVINGKCAFMIQVLDGKLRIGLGKLCKALNISGMFQELGKVLSKGLKQGVTLKTVLSSSHQSRRQ